MGFGNSIRSSAVPEWRDFYVDYDKLRAMLRSREFKTVLVNELARVNNFYFLLEKKAVDEKNKIFDDAGTEMPGSALEELRAHTEDTDGESRHAPRGGAARRPLAAEHGHGHSENEHGASRSLESENEDLSSCEFSQNMRRKKSQIDFGLKRFMDMPSGISRRRKEKNITEFLHSLIKIAAYRDLNASALLKLARKYADQRGGASFYEDFSKKLKSAYFYKSTRIEQIRVATKRLYRRIFAKNQPEKAKMVFHRIRKGLKSSDWAFIASGGMIGISVTLAIVYRELLGNRHMFWAIFNIFIGFILFGFCLKIFKSRQINYKFIFNFDICSSMNNSLYLLAVSVMLCIYVLLFLTLDYLAHTYPGTVKALRKPVEFATAAAYFALFACPFDVLFYNSRIYLLGVYAHVLLSPLTTIRFRHFYFTDVAQSFFYSYKGIFNACGVENRAVLFCVAVLWPFLRILQCAKRYATSKLAFPHILNCTKFALGIIFTISKMAEHYDRNFRDYSVFFGLLNFLAGFFWDLLVDWHLLRSRYLYPKAVYAGIIAFSLVARILWVMRYLQKGDYPLMEAQVEIVRRFLWTLVRVEVEHLNNCDALRTKSVINLTAGELFYKRDQEEAFHGQSETEAETETGMETEDETADEGKFMRRADPETDDETEDEERFVRRPDPGTESDTYESNGGESCDDAL
ncbi:xenotropic and polytropic retrovirus receptor 1 [Pancytospora philotis]|nr:xenotropic and polytropic retrovirus receptor 1 [Pancytospora philotis]